MYISKLEIKNIRSIQTLEWAPPAGSGPGGWHIILGNNGAGKSTFLKAIALALMGPRDSFSLRQNWKDWLRHGEQLGHVTATLVPEQQDKYGSSNVHNQTVPPTVGVEFFRDDDEVDIREPSSQPVSAAAHKGVWNGKGWFIAAYGPFRRFGSRHFKESSSSNQKLLRCISLFDDGIALTESLEWLQNLQFIGLENTGNSPFLDRLKQFINHDDFLPSGVKLNNISSKGVEFIDGSNIPVNIESLSDGFRSVLSMTLELIRQLSMAYGQDGVFPSNPGGAHQVVSPGVVLIDEIDAHLHPTWQQRIGQWFLDHFPNIQFIVSTHSPLICQSADHGSIFVLPQICSDDRGYMLKGEELQRILYGNVLDAYGTDAFGEKAASTRSEFSKAMSRKLSQLNAKEISTGLTEAEKTEQAKIKATLPSKQNRGR